MRPITDKTVYLTEPKSAYRVVVDEKTNKKHVEYDENKMRRRVCLRFSVDENGKAHYGASIFKKEKNHETWNKAALRKTASERFNRFPQEVTLEGDLNYSQVVQQLRKAMYKNGVEKRHSDDKQTEENSA